MADDWQTGDLALCVDDAPNPFWGEHGLRSGAIYTVTRVTLLGGLWLAEANHHPESDSFDERRFRKIRPHTPDAEDAETIKLMRRKEREHV